MPYSSYLEEFKDHYGSGYFSYCSQLVDAGRVHFIEIGDSEFIATVRLANQEFRVEAMFSRGRTRFSCTCRTAGKCIHLVTATIAAQRRQQREAVADPHETLDWKRYLEQAAVQAVPLPQEAVKEWQLIYILNLSDIYFTLRPGKAYLRKDGNLGRSQRVTLDELPSIRHLPQDRIGMTMLAATDPGGGLKSHLSLNDNHYSYGRMPGDILQYLASPIYLMEPESGTLLGPVTITDRQARMDWSLEEEESRYLLRPSLSLDGTVHEIQDDFFLLSSQPAYALQGLNIFPVAGVKDGGAIARYLRQPLPVAIAKNEFESFLQNAYMLLQQSMPIDFSSFSGEYKKAGEMRLKVLQLKEIRQGLRIDPWFVYGDFRIRPSLPQQVWHAYNPRTNAITEINRDEETEKAAMALIKASGAGRVKQQSFYLLANKVMPWLLEQVPALEEQGFVVEGMEEFKKYRFHSAAPHVQVGVTTGIDWFDVSLKFSFDGIELSQKELAAAIHKNTAIVQLADKSFARLPQEWVKKLQYLHNLGEFSPKRARIARPHITLVELLSDEAGEFVQDDEFRKLREKLQAFSEIQPQAIPQGLQGELRGYQKAGYDWLCFLQEFGLGGCLADDMGLGKTVQALALLLREKERGITAPSLVVCPTSLVFNWQQEAARFVPALKLRTHFGLDRRRSAQDFADVDLVLTTYGTLLRDIEFLKDVPFHYAVLDESQKIKNPLSHSARAARLLKARHRLVLTGTPVENNTVELWSQFAFLNPGLLGNLHYFRRSFSSAIEKEKDEAAAGTLRRLVYPFILRRKKEQVATELPPRNEQILHCEMQPEQEKIYNQWRDRYRMQILAKIDSDGMDRARMNILEGLVRLRQIACHPHLVDPSLRQDSGKFLLLKETLEEILAENHKVLIFSQFVKMLDLMRQYLDHEGRRYAYLDGSTRDRQAVVESFQNDEEIRIFLISLRAGGTGLNLTAADYVILHDPWWNPAVEMQASDRTHRIGQDKPVFIYRLITRESVEEKMLQLQERKRALVSQLISTDASFFKQLTREDVADLFS